MKTKKDAVKLAATLTIPRGAQKFPAVILITGSGAQDRNETVAGHRPFLVLADYLTRKGIAVLRVDDRGMGGSGLGSPTETSENFAGDVLAGIEMYWGKGDLRITPRQQIELLVRLYENDLPFKQSTIDLVKEIMIAEKTENYVLRGKTGWSPEYTPQVGWWIGYVERAQNAYFFALEMDMKGFEDAGKRKTITKEILKSLQIID